jgi:hypothetical protein
VIEALLAAPSRLYLVPQVTTELAGWLLRRPSHPITNAIKQKAAAIVEPEIPTGAGSIALAYYTSLLANRRRVARLVREGQEGNPEEIPDDELLARTQRRFGARGRLLAGKSPGPLHTDEFLVYMAVEHTLRTGQPTMILTNDPDVEEQFLKLVWLLSSDYRAMHCARRYAADPLAHTIVTPAGLDEPNLPFEPDGALLVFGDWGPRLENALPEDFSFVPVSCLRGDNARMTHLTFGAEREMFALLEMKDRTGGKSTDLLGERNVHAPIPHQHVRDHAGSGVLVVRDKTLKVAAPMHFSLLDAHFALLNNETFGQVRLVGRKRAPPRAGAVLDLLLRPG